MSQLRLSTTADLDPSTAGSPATKGISAQARSLWDRIEEPDQEIHTSEEIKQQLLNRTR